MKKYLFMKQSTIIVVTKITEDLILIKTCKKFSVLIGTIELLLLSYVDDNFLVTYVDFVCFRWRIFDLN